MHVVIIRHVSGAVPDDADRQGIRAALASAVMSHSKRSVTIGSVTRLDEPAPRIAIEAVLSDEPGPTADEAFDGIDWSSIPQPT
jgi:hypothetical protein